MESLASLDFRAKSGENSHFILMHSDGSRLYGHEIDVPLNYADYYFLEAPNWIRNAEKGLSLDILKEKL